MTVNQATDDETAGRQQVGAAGIAVRDERLRRIMADLAGWSAQRWTYEDAPNLVVYSIMELTYSYPKRAHDLIESMRSLMQSDRVVPAVILGRALVETIAMGCYFVEKMERRLAEADYSQLEADFLRFYMGSKITETSTPPVHVNDALRHLKTIDLRYVSYLVNKYPTLWDPWAPDPVQKFEDNASPLNTYDQLSEISHPNGLGTQYLYPATDSPDNQKIVAYYRLMTGAAIWQAHHLLAALERMKNFANRFVSTFPDRSRFSDGFPGSGPSQS